MLASGTAVGRYVVLDQLGEGAMGEVYRAWDNALDRVVALKILLPLRAENEVARKRFSREARLAARLNHPTIAHVYDVGEHDHCPFIAMEFVPGRQLREEMKEPMAPGRVTLLARQILHGLVEAHRQGVVHRDLKPENILISGRDQVKILDFGLAKQFFDDVSDATELTTTGLTGTPRYMAPEQVQGGTIDPRTDIFALGTVLYEMVAGQPAHSGSTLGEMLMAVVHRPPPVLAPDDCPTELSEVIQRALQKKQDDRYQSAADMLDALTDLEASEDRPRPTSGTHHVPHARAEMYAQRGREALTGYASTSSLAIDLLEEAINIDPKYALPYAIYAEACAALFNIGQRDATFLDKAQESLEMAEALDPTLPDLRVARARIIWTKTFNFPAETALRELRWALREAPDHTGALRLWATITGHVGLLEHTEIAIARRQSTDPEDDTMRAIGASLYLIRGEPQRAMTTLEPLLRLDPRHEETVFWWIYAHGQLLAGRAAEAADTLQTSLRHQPADPLSLALLAVVCAVRGDAAGARENIDSALSQIRGELHPHHAYHLLAGAHSCLGEIDAAVDYLARSANEGMPCWPWFNTDPLLANLRESREGARFLADLKRRFDFFQREFPLQDKATLSFVATEVSDG